MITPIQRLAPLNNERQLTGTAAAGYDGPSFKDVFHNAAEQVRETDRARSEAEYQLATGQLDNPASLMISAAKNEIAVSMMVQLRNKSMEAYNELMRINI